jgi:DNA polymerase/3'-5' exonuclease PolX
MDGILYPIEMARAAYDKLYQLLIDSVDEIEPAGSVRRGRAYVHDLDVVVHAKYKRTGPVGLFEMDDAPVNYQPADMVQALAGIVEVKAMAKIVRFEFERIPVELYIAERDGSNFEALLQMRTGSAAFNASLASRARRMGLEYRAGYGLYQMGRRVDDGTERGIFAALHLPYLTPERRN